MTSLRSLPHGQCTLYPSSVLYNRRDINPDGSCTLYSVLCTLNSTLTESLREVYGCKGTTFNGG